MIKSVMEGEKKDRGKLEAEGRRVMGDMFNSGGRGGEADVKRKGTGCVG